MAPIKECPDSMKIHASDNHEVQRGYSSIQATHPCHMDVFSIVCDSRKSAR